MPDEYHRTVSVRTMANKDSEIEDAFKRIRSQRGIVGVMLVNSDGVPIKSTLDDSTSERYGGPMRQLTDKARSVVRNLDASDDLMFFRMRIDEYEIITAPENDYTLIAIQNLTDEQPRC